jgi:glycosyltransferase involved in cell wall biosynthesis
LEGFEVSGISQAAIEFSASPPKGGLAAFYRSPAPSRERAEGSAIPLAGKTVVIVHPAWHSCGTHQVVVSQLAAYKSLGARTISIAIMDNLLPAPDQGARWSEYVSNTVNLGADRRFYTAPTFSSLAKTSLLRHGWWPLIHGDQATWLIELSKRAVAPAGLEKETIDFIHANHYFTMPLVEKIRAGKRIPTILDTHDIQARQYALRNRDGFFIPPYATLEQMLTIELEWMKRADVCVHLNQDERAFFLRLLPEIRHALIHPAVPPATRCIGGPNIVIVASNNSANYHSLRWFLKNVAPLVPNVPISIFGNVDAAFRKLDGPLYEANRNRFKGRVDDIADVYAEAACVLLPTIEGHGLSIKAVEALSSGAPIIATSQAFRGIRFDPRALRNLTIADDPANFAAAVREVDVRPQRLSARRAESDTHRFYAAAFSSTQYANRLGALASGLISREMRKVETK